MLAEHILFLAGIFFNIVKRIFNQTPFFSAYRKRFILIVVRVAIAYPTLSPRSFF